MCKVVVDKEGEEKEREEEEDFNGSNKKSGSSYEEEKEEIDREIWHCLPTVCAPHAWAEKNHTLSLSPSSKAAVV